MVGEWDLHYMCKVVGKQAIISQNVLPEIVENHYENGDYHVLYYGEIVGTYFK